MNSILIIDDEEVDFIIHSKILKLSNCAQIINYQSSALSALEYLMKLNEDATEWPTHIFLDLNMPQMDGLEFIEAYKTIKSETPKNTKIYILSSSINPNDREKVKKAEIVEEFLTKPLTIEIAKRLLYS